LEGLFKEGLNEDGTANRGRKVSPAVAEQRVQEAVKADGTLRFTRAEYLGRADIRTQYAAIKKRLLLEGRKREASAAMDHAVSTVRKAAERVADGKQQDSEDEDGDSDYTDDERDKVDQNEDDDSQHMDDTE